MSEMYLTAEEAFNLIQDDVSIVSTGAYTFSKDHYFSYGTYPQCLRGGNNDLTSMKRISSKWKVMTDYDIVMSCGYQELNCCAYQLLRSDGTVDFRSLNNFLESNLTVKDYKDPEKNKRMVAKYFEESYYENSY